MGSSERVQVSVLVMLLTISHFTQRSDQELGGVVGVGQPGIRRQGGVASLISIVFSFLFLFPLIVNSCSLPFTRYG